MAVTLRPKRHVLFVPPSYFFNPDRPPTPPSIVLVLQRKRVTAMSDDPSLDRLQKEQPHPSKNPAWEHNDDNQSWQRIVTDEYLQPRRLQDIALKTHAIPLSWPMGSSEQKTPAAASPTAIGWAADRWQQYANRKQPTETGRTVSPNWSPEQLDKLTDQAQTLQATIDVLGGKNPVVAALQMDAPNAALKAGELPMRKLTEITRLFDAAQQKDMDQQIAMSRMDKLIGRNESEEKAGQDGSVNWSTLPNRVQRFEAMRASEGAVQQTFSQMDQRASQPSGTAQRIMKGLTDEQHEFVTSSAKKQVLVGGPGGGKSSTIAARVANLAQQGERVQSYVYTSPLHSGLRALQDKLTQYGPLIPGFNAQEMNARTPYSQAMSYLHKRSMTDEEGNRYSPFSLLKESQQGYQPMGVSKSGDVERLGDLHTTDKDQGQEGFIKDLLTQYGVKHLSGKDVAKHINDIKANRSDGDTYMERGKQGKADYEQKGASTLDSLFFLYESTRKMLKKSDGTQFALPNQTNPQYDLMDSLEMAKRAAKKPGTPKFNGVVADEVQDMPREAVEMFAAMTKKTAHVVFGGDESQKNIYNDTHVADVIQQAFTSNHHDPQDFQRTTLSGTMRLSPWNAAFANAISGDAAMEGRPKSPFMISARDPQEWGKFPEFHYAHNFRQADQMSIDKWFGDMGLPMNKLAENLTSGTANPFEGAASTPAQHPFIFMMHDRRKVFERHLQEHLGEHLGPELGSQAFEKIYSNAIPSENQQNRLYGLVMSQAKGREFENSTVDMTRIGNPWQYHEFMSQLFTMGSRAKGQQRFIGANQGLNGSTFDNTPDRLDGDLLPHGSVPLISRMIANGLAQQNLPMEAVPDRYRSLAVTPFQPEQVEYSDENAPAMAQVVDFVKMVMQNGFAQNQVGPDAGIVAADQLHWGQTVDDNGNEERTALPADFQAYKLTPGGLSGKFSMDADAGKVHLVNEYFRQMIEGGPEQMQRYGYDDVPNLVDLFSKDAPMFRRYSQEKDAQGKKLADLDEHELYPASSVINDAGTISEQIIRDVNPTINGDDGLNKKEESQYKKTRATEMKAEIYASLVQTYDAQQQDALAKGRPDRAAAARYQLVKASTLKNQWEQEQYAGGKKGEKLLAQIADARYLAPYNFNKRAEERASAMLPPIVPSEPPVVRTGTKTIGDEMDKFGEMENRYLHHDDEMSLGDIADLRNQDYAAKRLAAYEALSPEEQIEWEKNGVQMPPEHEKNVLNHAFSMMVNPLFRSHPAGMDLLKSQFDHPGMIELISRYAKEKGEPNPFTQIRTKHTILLNRARQERKAGNTQRAERFEWAAKHVNDLSFEQVTTKLTRGKDKTLANKIWGKAAGLLSSPRAMTSAVMDTLDTVASDLTPHTEWAQGALRQLRDHNDYLQTNYAPRDAQDSPDIRMDPQMMKRLERSNPRQAEHLRMMLDNGKDGLGTVNESSKTINREYYQPAVVARFAGKNGASLGISQAESRWAPMVMEVQRHAQRLQNPGGGHGGAGGILDPMQGQWDEERGAFLPSGNSVTLKGYQQRIGDMIQRHQGSPERLQELRDHLHTVSNLRSEINRPDRQEDWGHYLNIALKTSMGRSPLGNDEEGEEDTGKKKPIDQFFQHQRNRFAPGQYTLGGTVEYYEALHDAMTHMQQTGTIQRGKLDRVLTALGHNPADPMFKGLRTLEQTTQFSQPEHALPLEALAHQFYQRKGKDRDERFGQVNNALGEFSRYPLRPNEPVVFTGRGRGPLQPKGDALQGELGMLQSFPQMGMQQATALAKQAKDGTVPYAYRDQKPGIFGTARDKGLLNTLGMVPSKVKDLLPKAYGTQGFGSVPAEVPGAVPFLFNMTSNGAQVPVTADQVMPYRHYLEQQRGGGELRLSPPSFAVPTVDSPALPSPSASSSESESPQEVPTPELTSTLPSLAALAPMQPRTQKERKKQGRTRLGLQDLAPGTDTPPPSAPPPRVTLPPPSAAMKPAAFGSDPHEMQQALSMLSSFMEGPARFGRPLGVDPLAPSSSPELANPLLTAAVSTPPHPAFSLEHLRAAQAAQQPALSSTMRAGLARVGSQRMVNATAPGPLPTQSQPFDLAHAYARSNRAVEAQASPASEHSGVFVQGSPGATQLPSPSDTSAGSPPPPPPPPPPPTTMGVPEPEDEDPTQPLPVWYQHHLFLQDMEITPPRPGGWNPRSTPPPLAPLSLPLQEQEAAQVPPSEILPPILSSTEQEPGNRIMSRRQRQALRVSSPPPPPPSDEGYEPSNEEWQQIHTGATSQQPPAYPVRSDRESDKLLRTDKEHSEAGKHFLLADSKRYRARLSSSSEMKPTRTEALAGFSVIQQHSPLSDMGRAPSLQRFPVAHGTSVPASLKQSAPPRGSRGAPPPLSRAASQVRGGLTSAEHALLAPHLKKAGASASLPPLLALPDPGGQPDMDTHEEPPAEDILHVLGRWIREGNPAKKLHAPSSEQLAAITSPARNKIIKGGPGAGKSATLARSVMHRVTSGEILPNQMLSLSAMRSGVGALDKEFGAYADFLPKSSNDYQIPGASTFHALAHSIITSGSSYDEGQKGMRFPALEKLGVNFSGRVLVDPNDSELEQMNKDEQLTAKKQGRSAFIKKALQQHGMRPNSKQLDEYGRAINEYKKNRGAPGDRYDEDYQQGQEHLSQGVLSKQSALVAYQQAMHHDGMQDLDYDDFLHYGSQAMEQQGFDALPEHLKDIKQINIDEAQDSTPVGMRMLKGVQGALEQAGNAPHVYAGMDEMQSMMQNMGGVDLNQVMGLHQSWLGVDEPHRLTKNFRSDASSVALHNSILSHPSLTGQAKSDPQTPTGRAIGNAPEFTLAKSQPTLYRKMFTSMLKQTGTSMEELVGNLKSGKKAFEGIDWEQEKHRIAPKETPAILSTKNQQNLFEHEVKQMLIENGLSTPEAHAGVKQLLRRNIVPENAPPQKREEAISQFPVIKAAGARSLQFKEPHVDSTVVGGWLKGSVESTRSYLRNLYTSISRVSKGGTNHIYATNHPFNPWQQQQYLNDPTSFLDEKPDQIGTGYDGNVFLNGKAVKPSPINAFEQAGNRTVPAYFSGMLHGQQQELAEWQQQGILGGGTPTPASLPPSPAPGTGVPPSPPAPTAPGSLAHPMDLPAVPASTPSSPMGAAISPMNDMLNRVDHAGKTVRPFLRSIQFTSQHPPQLPQSPQMYRDMMDYHHQQFTQNPGNYEFAELGLRDYVGYQQARAVHGEQGPAATIPPAFHPLLGEYLNQEPRIGKALGLSPQQIEDYHTANLTPPVAATTKLPTNWGQQIQATTKLPANWGQSTPQDTSRLPTNWGQSPPPVIGTLANGPSSVSITTGPGSKVSIVTPTGMTGVSPAPTTNGAARPGSSAPTSTTSTPPPSSLPPTIAAATPQGPATSTTTPEKGSSSPSDTSKKKADTPAQRWNNDESQFGHSMARIGGELQFIGQLFGGMTASAIDEGSAYRRATIPTGAAGANGTSGWYNFSQPGSIDSYSHGVLPMYSDTQVAQGMQQLSGMTNTKPNAQTVSYGTDAMGLAAITGMDSTELMHQMTSITGMLGQGSTATVGGIGNLSGMLTNMYGSNLTSSNVGDTLSALQQAAPTLQGLQAGGPSQLSQVMSMFQLGSNAGMSSGNMGDISQLLGNMAQMGSAPNLQQQYSLGQMFGTKNLTANTDLANFNSEQTNRSQQSAELALQQNIGNGLSLPNLQIQISQAQITMDKAQLDMSNLQQSVNVQSYDLQQKVNDQLYGPIGADTSKTAYFNFEKNQVGAAANSLNPEAATNAKNTTTNTFGLKNEEFYSGMEHDRTMLTLGRSSLLSDMAYQEQMKNIDKQESFYVQELAIQNEQRQFQKDSQKQILDQQANVLDLQNKQFVLSQEQATYNQKHDQITEQYLAQQAADLAAISKASQEQVQGKGPVNGQYVQPEQIIQQLASQHLSDSGLRGQIMGMGLAPADQQTMFTLTRQLEKQGGDLTGIKAQLQSADNTQLRSTLSGMVKNGAFADQQNTASQANAALKFGGTGANWDQLIATMNNLNNTMEQLASFFSPQASFILAVGKIAAVIGTIAMGVGAIYNILGIFKALPNLFGGAKTATGAAKTVEDIATANTQVLPAVSKATPAATGGGSSALGALGIAGLIGAYQIGGAVMGWNSFDKNANKKPWYQQVGQTALGAINPGIAFGNTAHSITAAFQDPKYAARQYGKEGAAAIDWIKTASKNTMDWLTGANKQSKTNIDQDRKNSDANAKANLKNINDNATHEKSVHDTNAAATLKSDLTNMTNYWGTSGVSFRVFMGGLGQQWNTYWAGVQQRSNQWFSGLFAWLGSLGPSTASFFANAGTNVAKEIASWGPWFQSTFGPVISTISKGFSDAFNTVKTTISGIFGGFKIGGGAGGGAGEGAIPSPGVISNFGKPMNYGPHQGVDFAVAQGTNLKEFVGGNVSNTGFYPWGGEVDVAVPGGLTERYVHLSQIDVKTGQGLKRGDHIGLTGGGTPQSGLGYWSSGPHSHVQFDRGDELHGGINPWPIWSAFGIGDINQFYGGGGGGAGGIGLSSSDKLHHLAEGGIAMSRITTELGEKEPEAVIPISKLTSVLQSTFNQSRGSDTVATPAAANQKTTSATLSKVADKLEIHVHTTAQSLDAHAQDELMAQLLEIFGSALRDYNGKLN